MLEVFIDSGHDVLLLIGSLKRKEKKEQFPKQGCPHRKGGQLHAVA